MLPPNPNECNSTLTSGTRGIYPHFYIDADERGHRLRVESLVTNLPRAPSSVSPVQSAWPQSVSFWCPDKQPEETGKSRRPQNPGGALPYWVILGICGQNG